MQVGRFSVAVGLILIMCAKNATAQSRSSECCTISGYVSDENSRPLPRIPITIKRSGEILRGDYKTDANGYYSINYGEGRGTLEAVIYGNTKWGPSIVQNLSGTKSHILNKVLVNAEQSKFSLDQASDVLAVLDYIRLNENLYSKEILQFAGVFKRDGFPSELRPRLTEFEQVAATIKKRSLGKELPREDYAVIEDRHLTTARSKPKSKPKPGGSCSQGTPYRNCLACGKTTSKPHQQLNLLKNRDTAATNPQKITVQEIRDPANDQVFTPTKKVWVTGFVATIDDGGLMETCNCKRSDLRDVHINIVADPSEVHDKTKYVVVEFTPRWEKRFNFDDSDYPAMKQAVINQIGGKWVKFEGYMMSDWVQKAESKNTANSSTPTCKDDGNDPKPCVWRATTWEVHPVTAYTVVTGP